MSNPFSLGNLAPTWVKATDILKGDRPGHAFHGNQYGSLNAVADLRSLAARAENAPVRQRISFGQDALGRTWNKGNAGYGYKVSEKVASANREIAREARKIADKIEADPKTVVEHIAEIRQLASAARQSAFQNLMFDNFSTGFGLREESDLLDKIADHLEGKAKQAATSDSAPASKTAEAIATQGTGADKTYDAHKAAEEAWLDVASAHFIRGETEAGEAAKAVAKLHTQQAQIAAAENPYETYIPKEDFDKVVADYQKVVAGGGTKPQESKASYVEDTKEAARLSAVAAAQRSVGLSALAQKSDAHAVAAAKHNSIRAGLLTGKYPEIPQNSRPQLAAQHGEAANQHQTAGFVAAHASTPGSSDDSVDSAESNGDKANALSQRLAEVAVRP